MPATLLMAAIGDIHGRFARVEEWLEALGRARGRPVDLALAVGDVEAFAHPEAPLRKRSKYGLPAEFQGWAAGPHRPLYFIGGNNEDFAALHPLADGGEVAPGVFYLGRAGARRLHGLQVAYLSGIHAPKRLHLPLAAPTGPETARQAGYFRAPELDRLARESGADVMLVHEWPRGLIRRGASARPLRAHRFPWVGNPLTRGVVHAVRPRWLLCGHSHVPLATSIEHPDGARTQVACLDQASRPEGALLWIEWEDGAAARAGWGTSGAIHWRQGEPWDEALTPA